MASQTSVASSQPDARHLRLIAASAQANEARVREILAEDSSWNSQADRDALRGALLKVATRRNLALVRLLLEHGADVDVRRDGEIPALFKAAENGHAPIVEALLARGARTDWRNRNGQSALSAACMRGHAAAAAALLAAGADVNVRDRDGRSPLLCLAAEKPDRLDMEVVAALLRHGADVDVRDSIGRSPLLWAATNGNLALAAALLAPRDGRAPADITATNNRGRTALHLAAESNHAEVVELLLAHGADPRAVSDGGWTALHNAAQGGHGAAAALLLASDADPNAALSNGMTPLHWAAFNGHEDVVRLILARPDANIALKDAFDRSPMLCAAERYHRAIVQLLSPARAAHRLSPAAQSACRAFDATVVDFGSFRDGKKQLVFKPSVYDLLYGWDSQDDNKPKVATLCRNIKYRPAFRWIHLPANNIAWVETLLAKSFVEGGHRDIDSFKALEKCFGQEHRGPLAHAHFMRNFCQRISTPQDQQSADKDDRPLSSLLEEQSDVSSRSSQAGASTYAASVSTSATTKPTPSPTRAESEGSGKKKSKAEQIAERHPKRSKRSSGPPGNPPGSKDANKPMVKQLSWDQSKLSASNGKIVFFMPFLHYETDERRQKMSKAIGRARGGLPLPDHPTRDELLIYAYLNDRPPLHPRRTLDQFFYHGIDTSSRDTDQVVYRYCKRFGIEPKVFMVDQLWLWILGKDLVVTCFPQRWDQPKPDPMNLVDGIIEETNAKTRPPMQSVYDLAMVITSRCSGMFDRHCLGDQDYQFLDMFESSVGLINNRESQLFDRFNRASRWVAQWLQNNRQTPDDGGDSGDGDGSADALLEIGVETSLQAEIKDVLDELNIVATIIELQMMNLAEFENSVADELRAATGSGPGGGGGGGRRGAESAAVVEVRRRAREQRRLLEVHRKDVERMDRQAEGVHASLTHLLDLKQKHSNALEARFARLQTVIATRQGQAVIVFTTVTIIFLPMSFVAAFFAINFKDWEARPLTIGYVSRYLFGIGLAISVPLIAMAFSVSALLDVVNSVRRQVTRYFHRPRRDRRRSLADNAITGLFRGRSGGGGGYGSNNVEDADYEKAGWPQDDGATALARPRPSLTADNMTRPWSGRGAGSVSSRTRQARGSGAEWASGVGSRGSGGAVSWARPSLDDRRRARLSDDLEMGRAGRRRWAEGLQ